MKIKECEIHGIERIEGTKKSGESFAFWKLHCLVPSSGDKIEGMKAANVIVSDEEYEEEQVTLGGLCTLVTTGFDRYAFVMME